MTDNISPINAAAPQTETRDTAAIARQSLTEDLDTFLTLLTTQLQNQDPLQPMDTNQFVDQLTQFSELEQGVEQTDVLRDISAKLGSDGRQENINLLGRTVEVESETIALPSGQPAAFAYEITSPTNNAEMRIFDAADNLVAKFDVDGGVGRKETLWDGSTVFGGRAGAGLYRAQVVAKSATDEERLAGRILSTSEVREVRLSGETSELILESGQAVTTDQIRRVAVAPAQGSTS